MYIIEFEKGVYATKGSGDPARTLKVENAQRFSDWMKARLKLDKVLEEIKAFRKFPNAKVEWVDEVTGALGGSLHETSGLNIPRVSKTKRSESGLHLQNVTNRTSVSKVIPEQECGTPYYEL